MEDKILVTRPSMPPFEEYVNEIKSLWIRIGLQIWEHIISS